MKTIQDDAALIRQLGGVTAVAARLGFDVRGGGVQRVQNWMRRGIPASIKLAHAFLRQKPKAAK